MLAIAKERRDVSSASAAEDESRGRVENALQSINLPLRNPREKTVLIIAAGNTSALTRDLEASIGRERRIDLSLRIWKK